MARMTIPIRFDYDRFKDKAYEFYESYTKPMLIERIAMLELQLFRLQQEKEKEEENEKSKLSN